MESNSSTSNIQQENTQSSKAISVFMVNSLEEALQSVSDHEHRNTVKYVYHYKKKDFGETGRYSVLYVYLQVVYFMRVKFRCKINVQLP